MFEEIGTISGGEAGEEFADPAAQMWHGTFSSFAQQSLELAECLLDGIEIWRVLRKVEEFRPDRRDGFGDAVDFMGSDVVHDDDVAGAQGGRETLFDIGEEGLAVHRAFDNEGSYQFVMAQACDEGDRLPMSMRRVIDQSLAAWATSSRSHHVGADRRLIEKHQSGCVEQALSPDPTPTRSGYVGSVLLAGVQGFF